MKPKFIQRAMFAAGAGGHVENYSGSDKFGSPHSSAPVIRGVVIQIAGINFESVRPTSAANAEFINRVAEAACK